MPSNITITQTEKNEALRIAKTLSTHLTDANETKAILAGLAEAKDQGMISDTSAQTARKAAQGVVNYLQEHHLVLPKGEQDLLVNQTKAFATKIVQGR